MSADINVLSSMQTSSALLKGEYVHPIKVLLIDDQLIIAEAIRRQLEGEANVYFFYCSDPEKAIQTAIEVAPTVILQDLVMPDIDGLMLLRYFRANPATKNIPMIVLSSKEDPKIKAEAFMYGANDYMVKLPSKEELVARIRYHSNAYIRLLERNEAYKKLEESQRILVTELTEAAEYAKSLLPKFLDGEITTSWRFIPSTQLGGDAFGYHWIDEDHFAIYLLDVCGHGVGAALLSISVIQVLRTQTLPKTDFHHPNEVLKALNEAFPMEKNNQMFFTIWYGVYNKKTSELVYSSGGHPPAVLITGNSKKEASVVELSTPGMVVGGISDEKFFTGKCKVGFYNRFFLFSDGVYEIEKRDGTLLKYQDFVKLLATFAEEGKEDLDIIVSEIQKYHPNQNFVDDFSIMQVIFHSS